MNIITLLANFAGAVDFIAIAPDIRRTRTYYKDLHGSATHEFFHVLGNFALVAVGVATGAYIMIATEGFTGIYKLIKVICLLRRKWIVTQKFKRRIYV